MPKLYQHSIHGHYYTKVYRGGFQTLQILPEGSEYLLSRGIAIGDDMGNQHYNELKKRKWLTSFGSGYEKSAVASPRIADLQLFLEEHDHGSWRLLLELPPLDPATAVSLPRGCGVAVEKSKQSTARLERGWVSVVSPSITRYQVETYGDWGQVDTTKWTCGASGLSEGGSVFSLRQGEWRRQGVGSFIRWGEEIRFLYRHSGALDLRFKNRHSVGAVEGWKIDSYHLPAKADTSVETWFIKQGLKVTYSVPSLQCLTPYSSFARSEGPGLDADQDVVFRASGVDWNSNVSVQVISGSEEVSWTEDSGTDDLFFALGGLHSGIYTVILHNHGQVVFPFRIVSPSSRSRYPAPLSVQIGDSMYPGIGGEPFTTLHIDRDGEIPTIAITAPDKVRWKWRPAPSGAFECGCVEEADSDVRMRLKERLESGELPSELLVDAGVYGSVSITFELEQANTTPSLIPEPLNDARVRWLASMAWKGKTAQAAGYEAVTKQRTAEFDGVSSVRWNRLDKKFEPHLRASRRKPSQASAPTKD